MSKAEPKPVPRPSCHCGSTNLRGGYAGTIGLKWNGKKLVYDNDDMSEEFTDVACDDCGDEVNVDLGLIVRRSDP